MNLQPDFSQELNRLAGQPALLPASVVCQHTQPDATLYVHVHDADRLACSLGDVRVAVPHLAGCSFATLTTWAQQLASRLTYLLEDVGLLELDENAGQVLMRSRQPATNGAGKAFYEVRLQANADNSFTLSRVVTQPGQSRQAVEMQLTQEVAVRLLNDIIETMPTS